MAPTPQNRPWTASQLQSDSKTLQYECEMLCYVARNLSCDMVRNDWAAKNAHVESFAVHCRNLIFFFYAHEASNKAGKPRKGDVLAVHFFEEQAKWDRKAPKISGTLQDAKVQADKQIAHITDERRELNQPGGPTGPWMIAEIVTDLRKVVAEFLDSVPKENLALDVKHALGSLISVSASEPPPSDQPPNRLQSPEQRAQSAVHLYAQTEAQPKASLCPAEFRPPD